MDPSLDDDDLAALAEIAAGHGLLRLGAVDLDHPGFAPARAALADYLDRGAEGEMAFMTRTRAVRMDPAQMLDGARSALVAVVPYAGEPGPVARYAQWADYHTELHRRLERLDEALRERVPGVESLICVDTKPVLERAVASLAGLGFLGKNGCLIVPGLGSYLVIAVLLTTARWLGADPREAAGREGEAAGREREAASREGEAAGREREAAGREREAAGREGEAAGREREAAGREREAAGREGAPWDACGSCRLCLDHCPTDAFDGPGRLDPRRCIAYLTIEHRGPIAEPLATRMGQRVAGCDVCQEVCPYNRSSGRSERVPLVAWLPPPSGRPRVPDLPRLANIGNNQHRQFVKHTPLNRIPRRAMRRNAILALANGEGPASEAEAEALRRASEDRSPELAELARWAAARRGIELDVSPTR